MSVEFDRKIQETLADSRLQQAIYTATGRFKLRRVLPPNPAAKGGRDLLDCGPSARHVTEMMAVRVWAKSE
jgi:hypothetical protein